MNLLRVEDIHTYYGRSYILQGASLGVRKEEVVALLGRNGAGKTTTLKTIMGLVKPRAGAVIFKDREITRLPAYKIARRGIGYVPQGRQLFPKMTVLENLKTGMRDQSDTKQLDSVFSLFPVLEERLSQLAGTLSGGEQQALAISRALVKRPDIILLDEPTTGLMPIFVSKLKEIIKRLNENGMAILLVEEKIPFALSVADQVYFMVKGKIEYRASREELEGKRELLIRYLGVEV
ncbi:MAG TPA: ABC transporter ATP-binding protein [Thermodesulfobacteriota bacterium]|nr:ABC transporter ATP-binding protein [Thermodesulfobacteriota bacterium]